MQIIDFSINTALFYITHIPAKESNAPMIDVYHGSILFFYFSAISLIFSKSSPIEFSAPKRACSSGWPVCVHVKFVFL